MSMHYHMPEQAIPADFWMYFSRVFAENENHHGGTREGWEGDRTYECVYGHRECMSVALSTFAP